MEVPPSIGQPLNSEAEASRSFHIECADHDQKKNFEAVPIDTYFAAIGEFGFYQKRHFVLVGSGWLALATGMLSMVFTNHRPNWRYPGGEVQTSELPCADMASGQVVELINTWHSTAGEWNLVCEHQWKATLLDSLFFVGVGFGAAWLGGLGDTLGRRKGYIIANVVLLCASLVSAASPSFEVYVILRIFVGVGVGGSGGITYCYMAEFMGASWQAIIGVAQSGVFFFNCRSPSCSHVLRSSRVALSHTCHKPSACMSGGYRRLLPYSRLASLASRSGQNTGCNICHAGDS
mmetsp:Transcript_14558/g.26599  ORF Transcript_14558/g.26599 Transcript_14558/m.26599 type:complete len:291 (-) Transcript_14558:292-1164(-)